MKSRWLWSVPLYCLLFAPGAFLSAQNVKNELIVNGNFASGLASWQVSGDVSVQNTTAVGGLTAVRLGHGAASIAQRVVVGPENHLDVRVVLKSDPPGSGKLIVHFLDRNGKELMSIDSDSDLKPGGEPRKIEQYFRPHPLTASVVIEIEKNTADGTVLVGPVSLDGWKENDPTLPFSGNVEELMRPFWSGSTVKDEAVLLLSTDGKPGTGTLMFRPTRILSVTDYGSKTIYKPDVDYTVQGRTLICTPASAMPQIRDTDLLKGELKWNKVGGRQVLVTYEHEDKWAGPVQPYVGAALPNTMRLLSQHRPLKIVAYGDSITFGIGASRTLKIPPFLPPWIELFTTKLKQSFNDSEITLYNAAQSGADSIWAKRLAQRMVGTLEPDLVVIAFGQNDFWRISPDEFASNIRSVITSVRAANPNTEFLLVSTMRFDPAYSSKAEYWNLVSAYDERLRQMQGPGVQLVDFTTISGAVYAAKSPKDCLNDPLHPNDYLSRWYAQSLFAALGSEADKP